ncbi:Alcohol dehydrogenase notN like protein [Verticillium longisporum]|uniref:Alcohol dehydrogenase notN like protein n=1 Tax=Verticillium longisporum TaxID=100787 RepID=A0A8I2YZA5_VERLO|nr:Alcohol dehydrogenase notN like protein [Verticillium longisporum]
MSTLPKTYKAWVVEKAGGPMVLKDLELKQPGPNQVLVRVRACGICHSDTGMSSGAFGDVFPRRYSVFWWRARWWTMAWRP